MVQIGQINLSTEDFNNIVNAVETAGCCGGSQGVGGENAVGSASVGRLANVAYNTTANTMRFDFIDGTIETRIQLSGLTVTEV